MRSILLSLLILLVAAPVAAQAATIRIEQQGPAGEPITGGCYTASNGVDSVSRCDYGFDADPGVVLLPDLPPGTYDVEEYTAPPGHYATSDFTVGLTDWNEIDRRVKRHQARPVLRVVTTDATGTPMPDSCWMVRPAGQNEGGFDECDADDGKADGVTRFLDLEAGEYELSHQIAPDKIDRIDDTTFTMPAAEDKTLTFALAPAVAPVNTVAPAVSGGHSAGDELTGALGTWTGSAEIDFNDAWERCELDGTSCQDVDVYETTYTPTAEDAGKALRYRVMATNDGGRLIAYSALHAIGSLNLPEPTTAPSITGSTRVGQLLTADPGEWSNLPAFSYQWQRCAAECTDIANAKSATYRTTKADAGLRLRVLVTARNSAGERSAPTAQTEPVNDGPYNQQRPSTTGTPAAHNDMEAYPGHWVTAYGGLNFEYVWYRCDLDGTSHCQQVGEGDVYRVSQNDEGSTILVEVTATDAGGSATARSNARTILTQRPLPTVPPTITGEAERNSKLTGHLGSWTPKPRSYDIYWQRCNDDGCQKIEGTDGDRTYKIGDDDFKHSLRFVVWANGTEGRGYAVSPATPVVIAHPPVNLRLPTITGTARVGEKLTGEPGEWDEKLDLVFYGWLRCNAKGQVCDDIEEEDGKRYKVTRADFGHTIKLVIVVTGADGFPEGAYSEPTAVVPTVPPVNTVAPSIAGPHRLGQTLTADRGTWTADRKIDYDHWWERCDADGRHCETIDGSENDRTYKITRDDLGHTFALRVLAQTDEGEAEAWSPTTSVIELQPPVALTNPFISGPPSVDQKLTLNLGEWTTALNREFVVRWYRCERDGTRCDAIPDADGRTYRLRYPDIDHRLKVQVRATSDEGEGSAWSAATDVIMR